MNQRQRLFKAINFEKVDRPPHFELLFQLTEEAFGLNYPSNKEIFSSTGKDRERLFSMCAELYAKTAEKYKWDAVCIWTPEDYTESFEQTYTTMPEFTKYLKGYIGSEIPVAPSVWHPAVCIETIKDYMQFAIDIAEEPEKVHAQARFLRDRAIENSRRHIEAGCDFIILPCDSGFNAGPFLSPKQFAEFTAPYLKEIIDFVKGEGIKIILHSDGNIMPILDQIIELKPDVLHSIDPMAGMDITKVREMTYGKVALMGNVQCDLLQDGPDEKIVESVEYAIKSYKGDGGFIFSSSNCIFTGLPLKHYEVMLDCFHNNCHSFEK